MPDAESDVPACDCESMGGRFGSHRPECPWQVAFEAQLAAESDVDVARFRAALVDGSWTVRSLVKTLAARRKTLGLRQADVAAALGFGQQYVSYWERGDGEPSLEQLQAYARLVGLEVRIDLCVLPPDAGRTS